MLTKKQSQKKINGGVITMEQELAKELKKAVKSLIKKTTGADEGTCLWYDPETKKFIIGEFDKNHKNRIWLYDKCAIEVEWDDYLIKSYTWELKLMLENPQNAQYRYPQNIIDKARELVKIKEYVIDNYCDLWSYFTAEDIFLESGAAEFMRKENIKHLIDTYTDESETNDLNLVKIIYDEAIAAYEKAKEV